MSLTGASDPHVIVLGEDGETKYLLNNAAVVLHEDSISIVYPPYFSFEQRRMVASGVSIFQKSGVKAFTDSHDSLILKAAEIAQNSLPTNL